MGKCKVCKTKGATFLLPGTGTNTATHCGNCKMPEMKSRVGKHTVLQRNTLSVKHTVLQTHNLHIKNACQTCALYVRKWKQVLILLDKIEKGTVQNVHQKMPYQKIKHVSMSKTDNSVKFNRFTIFRTYHQVVFVMYTDW